MRLSYAKIGILGLLTGTLLLISQVHANSNGIHLEAANINPADKQSLRRGANLFVDYCIGCHSLSFMRYNRIAKDLDMAESETYDQLIFTGAKFADQMRNAMRSDDARRWFGTQPPDLSVIARSRSIDWIYTYLRSFYRDPSRPWGVNNAVYKDVAMPHVLWELQGLQERVETGAQTTDSGVVAEPQPGFILAQAGKQKPEQFDNTVRDIVNFLHYVAEPTKARRHQLGKWVLGFLLLLFIVVYLLKKEYWKDIH
jgi:ubiquinol-cytochrome c reductase cytochrome c1 subunit